MNESLFWLWALCHRKSLTVWLDFPLSGALLGNVTAFPLKQHCHCLLSGSIFSYWHFAVCQMQRSRPKTRHKGIFSSLFPASEEEGDGNSVLLHWEKHKRALLFRNPLQLQVATHSTVQLGLQLLWAWMADYGKSRRYCISVITNIRKWMPMQSHCGHANVASYLWSWEHIHIVDVVFFSVIPVPMSFERRKKASFNIFPKQNKNSQTKCKTVC